jgi:hypothetical protein
MRKRAADRTHFQIQRTPVFFVGLAFEFERAPGFGKQQQRNNKEHGRAT